MRLLDRTVSVENPKAPRFAIGYTEIRGPYFRIEFGGLDIHPVSALPGLMPLVHPADRVLDCDVEEQRQVRNQATRCEFYYRVYSFFGETAPGPLVRERRVGVTI